MQSDLKYVGKGKPPPADARLPLHAAEYHAGGRVWHTLVDADGKVFEFGEFPTAGAARRVASHYNDYFRQGEPVAPWARRALTDAERARYKDVTDLFLRPAGAGAAIR